MNRYILPLAAAAARIAAQLPAHIPVFSSPLQRCRLLAEALHPAPLIDPRLQEMDFGEWEMTPWDRIQREALDGWATDPLGYRPPNGESVAELQQRVRHFIAEARGNGLERAALVTHAGVIKVIVGEIRELPPGQWMRLAFEYGSVACVELAASVGKPC